MDTHKALKKDLLALEKRFWTAIKEKDAEGASSLSDDSCMVVGAQGVGEIDKASMSKMVATASYELKDFSLDDVRIRQLSDTVVALAYKVSEDLKVDGKDVSLEAYDLSMDKARRPLGVRRAHRSAGGRSVRSALRLSRRSGGGRQKPTP